MAKSLSFTLSRTRAFQGDLAQWQLTRRLQPALCVCPGQEPTAQGWLSLAFVPLALLSLLSRELFPPQRPVPRGQREGSPDSSRVPEGLRFGGIPRTQGARGEDGGEEGSGGRRWVGGEEVQLCSPPPRTTQGQVGGEGSWGLTEPEPQPGLTPARCWEGGELWKEDGGRLDRQLLAMNINYFLHRQGCTALTVS